MVNDGFYDGQWWIMMDFMMVNDVFYDGKWLIMDG